MIVKSKPKPKLKPDEDWDDKENASSKPKVVVLS